MSFTQINPTSLPIECPHCTPPRLLVGTVLSIGEPVTDFGCEGCNFHGQVGLSFEELRAILLRGEMLSFDGQFSVQGVAWPRREES